MSSSYANMVEATTSFSGIPSAWDDIAELFEVFWRDTFPSTSPEHPVGEVVEIEQRLREHSEDAGWHPGSLRRWVDEGSSEVLGPPMRARSPWFQARVLTRGFGCACQA